MPPVPKPKRARRPHYIRQWREHVGLTQEEMAERVDVSRETVSRIENGIVPYSQDFLELAACAIGCDVEDLLSVNPRAWSLERQISKEAAALRPQQQQEVLAIIKALASLPPAA